MYSPYHSSRFALYNLVEQDNHLTFSLEGFISTTVDDIYQAMGKNPGVPTKESFIKLLNVKLEAKLNIQL